MEQQLFLVQGGVQLLQGPQLAGACGVVGPGVDAVPLAGPLGLVHRDVRAPQEHRQVAAVLGGQGQADADVGAQRDGLQRGRTRPTRAQLQCHGNGLVPVDVVEQDRELVAAEELVADVVTEAVGAWCVAGPASRPLTCS